jgi:hypothetical protein
MITRNVRTTAKRLVATVGIAGVLMIGLGAGNAVAAPDSAVVALHSGVAVAAMGPQCYETP